MKVAVIPARGGSKRIPHKNIKLFAGRPMIAYAIGAAKRAEVFDRIIVSTDDAEIAGVAEKHGAEVPFVRPEALSNDYAGTTEVIAHAVNELRAAGESPIDVCCIYATAPFVQPEDIVHAGKLLDSGNWSYVFSATTYPYPVFRSLRREPHGGISMLFPEHFSTRSQDLPEMYHDAGQFYWGKAAAWALHAKIFDAHSTIYPIPRWRVQDIDTEEDWIRAEAMASYLLNAPTSFPGR